MDSNEQSPRVSSEALLRTYYAEISALPRLTSQQEQEYARLAASGEHAALTPLILSALEPAAEFCRGYDGRGVALADLISAASIGILKAAPRFVRQRGERFFDFCRWWIRRELLLEFARVQRSVRIPNDLLEQGRSFLHQVARLEQEKGGALTPHEIAQRLNMTHEEVDLLLGTMQPDVSLDTPVEGGDENAPTLTLLDTLTNSDQLLPDQEAAQSRFCTEIRRALANLGEREREVLTLLFGIEGTREHTIAEAAARFGVSPERIRKIRKSALRTLGTDLRLQEEAPGETPPSLN